jgi:hypothetical protein
MTLEILKAFREAVTKSELTPTQKLTARLAIVNPRMREAIGEFIASVPNPATKTWFELFLEYLPEIIALIELILKLLDD